MVSRFYSWPCTIRFLRSGPLGPHIDACAGWLAEQGYACATARYKLRMVACLSRWLRRRHVRVEDLDEQRTAEFVRHKFPGSAPHYGNSTTFRNLLAWLRVAKIIPLPVVKPEESALERIAGEFARYLGHERGLSAATVKNYVPSIRNLLRRRFGDGPIILNALTARDVTGFVLHELKTTSPRRVQLVTSALRSFFRFLQFRGNIAVDLSASVPAVLNRRWTELPKSLPPEQVRRLLKSCDRRGPTGQRDYAMLLLMARLGLRAGEILDMTLDDVDWEAGVITIRGKGKQQDKLPIPEDVGKALVQYLRLGRPRCSTRRLFVRARAPFRGLARSGCVCSVVRYACARAGLSPPHQGPHLLRHSLATDLLRRGASLPEIGEILRHRQPDTTRIYAKLDLRALRSVAQPWMGGEA
jgi:site-specific recombinase XerD